MSSLVLTDPGPGVAEIAFADDVLGLLFEGLMAANTNMQPAITTKIPVQPMPVLGGLAPHLGQAFADVLTGELQSRQVRRAIQCEVLSQ